MPDPPSALADLEILRHPGTESVARVVPRGPDVRVAVVGKGGAGKSTIAGTLCRLLARRGARVLALDSDMQPGLAFSLGAEVPDEPPLNAAAERGEDGRWRLRKGIGPVRAVQRYSTAAPDGVRLLQAGKATAEGLGPVMGSISAFRHVVHRLPEAATLRGWTVVGDLPAGPRQVAYDWAPYAERLLLVVEPTWPSMLAALRIGRVVEGRVETSLVVSKAGSGDVRRVEEVLEMAALAAVPLDEAVVAADREGAALLDCSPGSPAVAAIGALADRLGAGRVEA